MLAPRTELLMHEKTFCWFWLWNPPGPGRFLEVAKQWLLNKALWIDDSMGLSESIQCIPLYIILLSITWLSLSMKWERRCSDFMEWHGMGFKHCSSGFVGPPSGTQSWQWEYIHTCVYMYIYPYTHIYIYTFQHVNGKLIEQNGGFSSKKQYLITRGHIKSHWNPIKIGSFLLVLTLELGPQILSSLSCPHCQSHWMSTFETVPLQLSAR